MSRVINLTVSEETATDLAVSFYIGEDGVIEFQLLPVEDITAWALQFTVRAVAGVGPNLFQYTIGSGITITDGPNGRFTVTIASADTSGLSPAVDFFDIQRTDATFRSELGIGTFTVLQPVINL